MPCHPPVTNPKGDPHPLPCTRAVHSLRCMSSFPQAKNIFGVCVSASQLPTVRANLRECLKMWTSFATHKLSMTFSRRDMNSGTCCSEQRVLLRGPTRVGTWHRSQRIRQRHGPVISLILTGGDSKDKVKDMKLREPKETLTPTSSMRNGANRAFDRAGDNKSCLSPRGLMMAPSDPRNVGAPAQVDPGPTPDRTPASRTSLPGARRSVRSLPEASRANRSASRSTLRPLPPSLCEVALPLLESRLLQPAPLLVQLEASAPGLPQTKVCPVL